MLQVKRRLIFSEAKSNDLFARVMKDCWDTFIGSISGEFNPKLDKIGVGLGIYPISVATHLQQLLEIARTSKDPNDFVKKVSTPKLFAEEVRKFLQVFKIKLSESKGEEISDKELWSFLRSFVVIHFDLETSGSRDTVHCWNRLLDVLKDRNEQQALMLFNSLTSIVADYSRSAGIIDYRILRSNISGIFNLKDQPTFDIDIARINTHTETILESIQDTIGGKLKIPRNEILKELDELIKENEFIIINGEPMVGKSVILKLFANRVRSNGRIIVFSVDRLSGTSFNSFLLDLNVKNDFTSILSAIASAPIRCLFIDGLDRILIEENRKKVLNDILRATTKFNQSYLKNNGIKDHCWKIICTCRSLETSRALLHLDIKEYFEVKPIVRFNVNKFTIDELKLVETYFPEFKDVLSDPNLYTIIAYPLVLDILTLPNISLPSEEIPAKYTHSWLYKWGWNQLIRLGEMNIRGKGKPDAREQFIIDLAMYKITEGISDLEINSSKFEVVNGLISDRIIREQNGSYEFVHDVYEDWALAHILKQRRKSLIAFLKQTGESLRLVRPFRLFSSLLLEVENVPEEWRNLLIETGNSMVDKVISPRWFQTVLSSPLFSPIIEDILPKIKEILLNENGTLYIEFLKLLRTACIQPNPEMYVIFSDLPEEELERYLVHWSIPIWNQWIPVIRFSLSNITNLSDKALFELTFIMKKWMINTGGNVLFRNEITSLCLDLLISRFLKYDLEKEKEISLEYEEKKIIRKNLLISVLWGADCSSKEVDTFIREKATRNLESGYYDFEELLLEPEGWAPICKNLPETAVIIFEKILCEGITELELISIHNLCINMGLKFTSWSPPTYFNGPFLALLRIETDKGLDLINRIINHATECWKLCEEKEMKKTPIPQIIKLSDKSIKIWGDDRVFQWFRYPTTAPSSVTSALMALEYWMNDHVKEVDNLSEFFERILQSTISAAVVGVCTSVALANYKISIDAIIPIIVNPVFWLMDIYRMVQDQSAESFVNVFSFRKDESSNRILKKMARQPHRKLTLKDLATFILFQGSDNTRSHFQNALRAFPDNPPFYFKEEIENKAIFQDRIEACAIWAAMAELENYEIIDTEIDREKLIQFKIPSELDDHEKWKYFEEKSKVQAFLAWAIQFRDQGKIGNTFSLDDALKFTKILVERDIPSYCPMNNLDDVVEKANAISAFISALILHRFEWLKENNYFDWCRKQLIIAATRPEPPKRVIDEVAKFPMGYRRSAAIGLPSLLLLNSKDKMIQKEIMNLVTHRNQEIRMYLFSGLKVLWPSNQKIIWRCINLTIYLAQYRIIHYRYNYPKKKQRLVKKIVNNGIFTIERLKAKVISYIHPYRMQFNNIQKSEFNIITQSLFPILASVLTYSEIDYFIIKGIDLLEDLLNFTVQAFIAHQQKDFRTNEWSFNNWNLIFFRVLSNAVLRILDEEIVSLLIEPILHYWEECPAIMEGFLRGLLLVGSAPIHETRFIDLWKYLSDILLSSNKFIMIKDSHYVSDELETISGLLVFVDRISSWKVDSWDVIENFTNQIDQWCNIAGINHKCFPYLIQFLRSIGFSLMPEYGINWIYKIMRKTDNVQNFLKKSKSSSNLANLLSDSWIKYKDQIKTNQEILRNFIYIIDELVKSGEIFATRLQSKLIEFKSSL